MFKKAVLYFIFFTFTVSAQMIGPKAVTQQKEYDFGSIIEGKNIEHYFIVTNSGGDILKITNVTASCGCTAAKPEKDELKPGESTKINFKFSSAGRQGRQEKYVYVNTNDPEKPQMSFKFYGNIIKKDNPTAADQPRIKFSSTQHDFGIIKEGGSYSYTFSFANSGKSTLKIKDIKTSCGCTAALISSKEIKPGGEGTIKIELDTKGREGRMSRTITVVSNDPEEPNKVLTIFAEPRKEVN